MLAELLKLKSELAGVIERGEAERAGEMLRDFRREYPFAWGLISSAFNGTPQELVDSASAYFPQLKNIPGAVEFAAKLQKALQHEWTKPRGARVPEEKRLKG